MLQVVGLPTAGPKRLAPEMSKAATVKGGYASPAPMTASVSASVRETCALPGHACQSMPVQQHADAHACASQGTHMLAKA